MNDPDPNANDRLDKAKAKVTSAKAPKCPICGKPLRTEAHTPFCSKRCRQVDLGRWLDEDYLVSRSIDQRDLDEG